MSSAPINANFNQAKNVAMASIAALALMGSPQQAMAGDKAAGE
jgi:hypothetical protein